MLLFFISNSNNIHAQGEWLEYLIPKEKKLMSIQVDMEFDYLKPNYNNLLIVGSNYKKCLKNGFPLEEGLNELYAFSDVTEFALNKITKNKLVGVVTYDCIGLDVYYVKDTMNIRKSLENVYAKEFKSTNNYIYIYEDKNKQYYYMSLYPKNLSDQFLLGQEYLIELAKKGDKLDDKRKVTHWAYFKKDKKRQKFEKKIKKMNFKIDSVYTSTKDKYPYQMEFSRKDLVDPKSIFELTNLVKVLTNSSNSIYGGWEFDPKTDEQFYKNN